MLTDRTSALATRTLQGYLWWKFHRHFHSVRVSGEHGQLEVQGHDSNRPLILYGNHCSWWDAFFVFMLGRRFGLDMRVMMEERNLRRYPFFRYTGAFGVDLSNERSRARSLLHAVRFLRQDTQHPRALLIYPHGRLVSPLEKQWPPFQPGLEALLRLCPQARAVPVAHEIVPGRHDRQEVFIEVGRPLSAAARPCVEALEKALHQTRAVLVAKALGEPDERAFYLRAPSQGLQLTPRRGNSVPKWTFQEKASAS